MKKLAKISLTTLFVIIAILIAGGITLKLTLTTDKIKSIVIEKVKENTGRTLTINGAVAWRIFPQITLEVNDFNLTNPNQPKEKLSASKLDVGVKILPLFEQRVEPTKLSLSDFHYQDAEDHTIDIDSINLAGSAVGLDQNFPVNIAITNIHGVFNGNINLTGQGYISQDINAIKLNDYKLTVNDSTATGDITLSGLNNSDKDFVEGIIFDGTTAIDKINLPTFKAQNIKAAFKMQDGVVTINPIAATLYDGTLAGNASVNLQQNIPQYTSNLSFKKINLQTLLQDSVGTAYLSGSGNLDLALTTKGADEKTITKNLNGTAKLAVGKGKLLNLGFAKTVQQAVALLHEDLSVSDDFDSINANAKITNGVAKVNMDLKAPTLTASGDGKINLIKSSLDIDLVAQYLKSKKTKDFQLPINFSGKFDNIKVSVKTDDLLKQAVKSNANLITDQAKKIGLDLSGLFN